MSDLSLQSPLAFEAGYESRARLTAHCVVGLPASSAVISDLLTERHPSSNLGWLGEYLRFHVADMSTPKQCATNDGARSL